MKSYTQTTYLYEIILPFKIYIVCMNNFSITSLLLQKIIRFICRRCSSRLTCSNIRRNIFFRLKSADESRYREWWPPQFFLCALFIRLLTRVFSRGMMMDERGREGSDGTLQTKKGKERNSILILICTIPYISSNKKRSYSPMSNFL